MFICSTSQKLFGVVKHMIYNSLKLKEAKLTGLHAQRISLLMRIVFSVKERCGALASAYAEILDNIKHTTITILVYIRGKPTSIYASTPLYHNSFLLKTI